MITKKTEKHKMLNCETDHNLSILELMQCFEQKDVVIRQSQNYVAASGLGAVNKKQLPVSQTAQVSVALARNGATTINIHHFKPGAC